MVLHVPISMARSVGSCAVAVGLRTLFMRVRCRVACGVGGVGRAWPGVGCGVGSSGLPNRVNGRVAPYLPQTRNTGHGGTVVGAADLPKSRL
jgi:hypothetical protein